MIVRALIVITLIVCGAFGAHAQNSVTEEARSLDEVIAKYRADRVMERVGEEELEASPLFMTLAERRIAFAHFEELYPTILLPASNAPSELPTELMDLGAIAFAANEMSHTLASLMQSQHLMGLVVIQDGKVRFEHYAPDHG